MIIVNYIMAILGPIAPIFVGNSYKLEAESRLCMATTKVFYSSILAAIVAYLIPLTIVTIMYAIIFCHVRQSARRLVVPTRNRITSTVTNKRTTVIPKLKREMKLMKNKSISIKLTD